MTGAGVVRRGRESFGDLSYATDDLVRKLRAQLALGNDAEMARLMRAELRRRGALPAELDAACALEI